MGRCGMGGCAAGAMPTQGRPPPPRPRCRRVAGCVDGRADRRPARACQPSPRTAVRSRSIGAWALCQAPGCCCETRAGGGGAGMQAMRIRSVQGAIGRTQLPPATRTGPPNRGCASPTLVGAPRPQGVHAPALSHSAGGGRRRGGSCFLGPSTCHERGVRAEGTSSGRPATCCGAGVRGLREWCALMCVRTDRP